MAKQILPLHIMQYLYHVTRNYVGPSRPSTYDANICSMLQATMQDLHEHQHMVQYLYHVTSNYAGPSWASTHGAIPVPCYKQLCRTFMSINTWCNTCTMLQATMQDLHEHQHMVQYLYHVTSNNIGPYRASAHGAICEPCYNRLC